MRRAIWMLLGVLLISSCTSDKVPQTKAPTRVKTELLSTGVDVSGQTYVGVVEEREATAVSFTSMGVVKRVLVSEGQAVGRGQLIAVIDDTQARNLLRGAEAAMAQATAQPSSRSGTGPAGVPTGSTNVIKVERWPAAMISRSFR